MLEGIEPVEIFHQFLFLAAIQFNNITRGKLFGVIFNRFVYISGFYSIQFRNISVKDNLCIPNDNDFTFCFYDIFLMSHNFFFLKLFGDKDTTFPRNFQGFREKILEKGEEKKKIGDSRN